MRVPNSVQTSGPWRIHKLTDDFQLEDVWRLPTPGGPDDFPRLVALFCSLDPSKSPIRLVRALFAIRWKIGQWLGWDTSDPKPPAAGSLRDRLPVELGDGSQCPAFQALPFHSLYLTDDEFAAEIANRTMHGVLHLAWVADDTGRHHGQMAVYVKRNGLLGTCYMAAIAPFRRLMYPIMQRQLKRAWLAA